MTNLHMTRLLSFTLSIPPRATFRAVGTGFEVDPFTVGVKAGVVKVGAGVVVAGVVVVGAGIKKEAYQRIFLWPN